MNVLFLSSWYPKNNNQDGDFVERHAQTASTFCNVTVLHVAFDKKNRLHRVHHTINKKVQEYIIYARHPRYNIPVITPLVKGFIMMRHYLRGYKYIKNKIGFKPDIIHANILHPRGGIAYLLSRRFGVPYIISEHSTALLVENPAHLKGFKLRVAKFVAKHAKCVMPVSEHLKENMIKFGIRAKYEIVPNVVDTDLFTLSAPSVLSEHKVFRFVHISGGNDKHKNISGIIHAIEMVGSLCHNFEFHLISGVAPEMQLPEQVYLYGMVSHEEIAAILKKCDALVMFSNYETFSIVTAEALACGKPVIISRFGGISDSITKELGIVVPLKNTQELAEAMMSIMQNHSTYNPNTIRAFAVKNFSTEIIAQKLQAVYNHKK
ncbi:MAG: glycosyltransferase [Bacteroidales bacterium]|jgi:glycosyltransferase involved in cell wall biosynthesis|nr:glycosyltransferase [Bacteroidales bacterium]